VRTLHIVTTLMASWLGMQAVHELGHVAGAVLTGAAVERVVLHPLSLSRTDLGRNPSPLVVAWSGPVLGALLPLALWIATRAPGMPLAYLARFFAGFCLVANGVYIGTGVFDPIGDSSTMARHGSATWPFALFAMATAPPGLWLWHREGRHFGLGPRAEKVSGVATVVTATASIFFVTLGCATGR
jgi:hypothetical protein